MVYFFNYFFLFLKINIYFEILSKFFYRIILQIKFSDKKYFKYTNYNHKRFYKKTDINREKNCLTDDRIFNSISEFEVFKSNHTDIIFIESVISPCKVKIYIKKN